MADVNLIILGEHDSFSDCEVPSYLPFAPRIEIGDKGTEWRGEMQHDGLYYLKFDNHVIGQRLNLYEPLGSKNIT